VRVDEASQVAEAVAVAARHARGPVPATSELILDVDMGHPCDPAWPVRSTLALGMGHIDLPERVALLVGPGVLRSDRAGDLRRLAAAASIGVANTWGAKGLFAWDSPFHMGTAGLQAEDFRLLGFADYDLVLSTGLDPDESPRDRWALTDSLELEVQLLGYFVNGWQRDARPIPPNLLYEGLAAVVQRLSPSTALPLSPARAVADVRSALPQGGLVAADAGWAGLWVARTFPTTEAGSVVVPATVAAGFAAAAALVAALSNRPAIALTDAPIDVMSTAVLDAARSLGAPLVLEAWHDAHRSAGRADHGANLREALRERQPTVIDVAVNGAHTAQLIDVAGPVVAWT
jgi:thiamine pyrophosphate-dependent acetolactate synthase large subunit-like protein